jgi:hypothetical protein
MCALFVCSSYVANTIFDAAALPASRPCPPSK